MAAATITAVTAVIIIADGSLAQTKPRLTAGFVFVAMRASDR